MDIKERLFNGTVFAVVLAIILTILAAFYTVIIPLILFAAAVGVGIIVLEFLLRIVKCLVTRITVYVVQAQRKHVEKKLKQR